MRRLPIDPLLPQAVQALSGGSRLVLRAAPGAGKTTRVPAALLDAGLGGGKDVVVLEPRRIAARAAAEYVAGERGTRVGAEVGYRVRFESRGGTDTRLWFVTEGVLSRSLLSDPFLEGVGVVVLDEFHERHLQGDVMLGVVKELQETVRPDLKLVVMSATLETEALARHLGGCAVLTSEGRSFAVEVTYEEDDERPLAARVTRAVERALDAADGDVLVFLPGAGEIRRAADALAPLAERHALLLVPLHGDLPLEAQHRALRPAERRKVVLATNVAETALTIEGVTAVVDSGLAREARFDPRHGVNRLEVVTISRASAEQRAGRAGRTRPGRCIRLWSRAEHEGRRERETPEVLRLDLSATVLELRAWGARDPALFPWLEPPPAAALDGAERLLRLLGGLDAGGAPTAVGRRMLELPVPPRLARVLIEAERRGVAAPGALLAALASERDICLERRAFGGQAAAPWPEGPSDLLVRFELFGEAAARGFERGACGALGLDERTVRAVERVRRQLASLLRVEGGAVPASPADPEALLRCLLAGFPDRVARRRAPGSPRGVMVGGVGVALDPSSAVRAAELFVAVDVEGAQRRERAEARVRLASAVRREWLAETFPGSVREERDLFFDPTGGRVVERRRELYVDLVLAEETGTDVDPLAAGEILAAAARRDPEHALGLGGAERTLLDRLAFLVAAMPELGVPPDPGALLADVAEALAQGRRSFDELRKADLPGAIRARLTAAQRAALERDAPGEIRLPSGRVASLRYERGKPPAVAARIQELFGLAASPRVAAGRVALVIEILAPSQRPVQVTDDLASFWRRTYPEVRKQLRGRYPKHPWPEDPFSEPPTSRARRSRAST